MRSNLPRKQSGGATDALEEHFTFLREEGIVRFVDPTTAIQKAGKTLTAAVANDVRDDEFCKLAVLSDITVWDVLRERLPEGFLEVFYAGAGTFMEAVSLQQVINTAGSMEALSDTTMRFASFPINEISNRDALAWFLNRYRFVVGGNPHIQLESYEVPFLQASSLRVNEALLVAEENDLIPFSDSTIHDRMLRLKVSRSAQMLREHASNLLDEDASLSESLQYGHIAVGVLDRLIPEASLAQRSLEEITRFRKKGHAQLTTLKHALGSLSYELDIRKPQREYYSTIRKVVETRVVPEILKAREELIKGYEASFGKVALESMQVVMPTLVATSFAGLGSWEIVAAAALAESTYLSTKGVNTLLDAWRAKRARSRSNYAYLIALEP